MAEWKSKIVGHGRVAPGSIRLNPLNYRRHPTKQTQALADAIAAVGFLKSVLLNKRTGSLIDGHARVEEAIKQNAPWIDVEYVDLSPEDEAIALATLDPIGELATVDPVAFERLLAEFNVGAASLQELIAEVADDAGLYRDESEASDSGQAPDDDPAEGPSADEDVADADVIEAEPASLRVIVDCRSEEHRDLLIGMLEQDGGYAFRLDPVPPTASKGPA